MARNTMEDLRGDKVKDNKYPLYGLNPFAS